MKIKYNYFDGLLLVLVARIILLSLTVWYLALCLRMIFIHLLLWSTASAIIFLSRGSGLQGLGSHAILPSAPHL